MNIETSEIIGALESYLRELYDSTPEETGIHITKLLIEHELVTDLFTIEVITLNDSYMLRTRNKYTSDLIGALPSFSKICGKLLDKTPCTHQQNEI